MWPQLCASIVARPHHVVMILRNAAHCDKCAVTRCDRHMHKTGCVCCVWLCVAASKTRLESLAQKNTEDMKRQLDGMAQERDRLTAGECNHAHAFASLQVCLGRNDGACKSATADAGRAVPAQRVLFSPSHQHAIFTSGGLDGQATPQPCRADIYYRLDTEQAKRGQLASRRLLCVHGGTCTGACSTTACGIAWCDVMCGVVWCGGSMQSVRLCVARRWPLPRPWRVHAATSHVPLHSWRLCRRSATR